MNSERWIASGSCGGVTCSTPEAAAAGLDVIKEGGSAVDAYLAACFVQTVLENGSTTVAGVFSVNFFESGKDFVEWVGGVYGPAAAEDYENYNGRTRDRFGGRGMPAPGFVAGAWAAHQEFGRLPWRRLLAPACQYARDGFVLGPEWRVRVYDSADGLRYESAQHLWAPEGVPLPVGSLVRQTELAETLEDIATGGPTAHYCGRFAQRYVAISNEVGGRLALSDLAHWEARVQRWSAPLDVTFRGYRMASRGCEMHAFAHVVAERIDLRRLGAGSAAALDAELRIWGRALHLSTRVPMNEVLDPTNIEREARELFERPRHPVDFRTAFGTNAIVAFDADGSVAYGTHSINCPTLFGTGILAGGAYAGYVLDRRHAREGTPSVPGIYTSELLARDGKAYCVAGSPGASCMVAAWQFTNNVAEFGMCARDAVLAPRFGIALPTTENLVPIEAHVGVETLDGLQKLKVDHLSVSMMSTVQGGLVSGAVRDDGGLITVVQDPRRNGVSVAY
jgi:gamma-glutamyltranspeptidase/glutathione hydrolase